MGGRELRTSHEFTGFTLACPARVWSALTATETASFLHGLTPHTTWEVGGPITFTAGPAWMDALQGIVLHVSAEQRLTYSLQSSVDDPLVFVTWRLRACSGGCAITLIVDDLDCPEDPDDAEAAWLPVLANLQRHLDADAARRD